MAECKSCGASIWWAFTKNGNRIPLDAQPVPDGNLVVSLREGSRTYVRHVADGEVPAADRYVTHFATCPHARGHRRG